MTETEPIPSEAPVTPGKSAAKPWLFGCSIGCLAMLIIFIVFSFLIVRWSVKQVNATIKEFEQRGFTLVTGKAPTQPLVIEDKVTRPTLFIAQDVNLRTGADTEVAVFATRAELHGVFSEKVYYRGKGELTIASDAELQKGLDAQARKVRVQGTVQGEITGEYDQFDDLRSKTTLPTTAPAQFF